MICNMNLPLIYLRVLCLAIVNLQVDDSAEIDFYVVASVVIV